MLNRLALPALIWAAPGCVAQLYGLGSGNLFPGVLGTFLLVLGLAYYSHAKGYAFAWGLWGLCPVVGVALLIALEPRPAPSARQAVETMILEEDPAIHPFPASKREAPYGGLWLLAVLGPLGFLLVAASPYLPFQRQSQGPQEIEDISVSDGSDDIVPDVAARKPDAASSTTMKFPTPKPAAAGKAAPPAPAGPPTSFAEKFKHLSLGMTVDQVNAMFGDKIEVISAIYGGGRIIKWESPDGESFAGRFNGDTLSRLTSLHSPAAKTDLAGMSSEIAGADMENELTPKGPIGPPSPPAPKAQQEIPKAEAEGPAPEDTDEPEAEDQPEAAKEPQKKITRVNEAKGEGRVRKAKLPKFTRPIEHGTNDVNIYNMRPNKVNVGIRSESRGQNVSLSPGGRTTVYLGNGNYTVYFIDPDSPNELKNAGGLQINSPPGTIEFHIQ